ncbi:hypothetical protein C8Q78DRAFT_1080483 [Trametes maxima]|nr:hypothetical protein C8Q78DRAFT_1080483 [Trametes maxima]
MSSVVVNAGTKESTTKGTLPDDPGSPSEDVKEIDYGRDQLRRFLRDAPNPGRIVPKTLAIFPDLPPDRDEGYYYVLGWPRTPVVEKRLEKYLELSQRRAKAQRISYPLARMKFPTFDRGILELRARAWYKHIYDQDAVPVDCKDPKVAEKIPIITIYHTFPAYLFHHPEIATYGWICAVLGRGAEWYKDPIPKELWHLSRTVEYIEAPMEYVFYLEDEWEDWEIIDDEDEGELNKPGDDAVAGEEREG